MIKYRGPYPYIDGLILRSTRRISRVLVRHDARADGKSGYTLRKLVSLYMNMFVNFSVLPLRVASVLGLAVSALGVLLAFVFAIEKIYFPGHCFRVDFFDRYCAFELGCSIVWAWDDRGVPRSSVSDEQCSAAVCGSWTVNVSSGASD